LRLAAEAVAEGSSVREYAERYEELKKAMEKWGYVDPDAIKRRLEMERMKDILDELARLKGLEFIRGVCWHL